MSSLHARSGTRVYAKSLAAGHADAALSTEEAQAVEVALAGSGANVARPEVRRVERARPGS
jgi:hypothetical protein